MANDNKQVMMRWGRLLSVGLLVMLVAAGCNVISGLEPTPTQTPRPLATIPGATLSATQAANARVGDQTLQAECLRDAIGCAVIPPDETIKIGMAGPMTGDFSTFGEDISAGGEMAIGDYGQYIDWQFELVKADTQGQPSQAIVAASDWATDPTVVGVAGHIFSGETREAIPIYEEAGLPMLSPSATNPELTRLGSDVFNRVAFTDIVQGEQAADYLFSKLNVLNLAVVHDGEPYGETLGTIVADHFEALGGTVTVTEVVEPEVEDIDALLTRIVESGAEAIYYGGYDDVAIVLVNELGRLRSGTENTPAPDDDTGEAEEDVEVLEPAAYEDLIFFGCDGTFGQHFLERTGESSEGAYSTSLIPPESDARAQFDIDYFQQEGVGPGVRTPYTWHGYDAVAALIYAVKQVAIIGDDGYLYVPRATLVDRVRNLQGYPGLTGDISCDEVGECSTTGPQFYVQQGGEWVLAP